MNVYERLNAIRKAVAYIQKDKQVGSGGWGYKAVTHDAVTAAVRESLIEHGVMIVPSLDSCAVIADTGMATAKGTPTIRFEAIFDIRFVNVADPTDFVSMRVAAHALDEGDKAPGKAVSYATKYAMLKLFSIETGEDDEDRVAMKVAKKVESDKGRVQPTAGAMEALDQAGQSAVVAAASEIEEIFNAGKTRLALNVYIEFKKKHPDVEPQAALRSILSSKCKSALRREGELMAKGAAPVTPVPVNQADVEKALAAGDAALARDLERSLAQQGEAA